MEPGILLSHPKRRFTFKKVLLFTLTPISLIIFAIFIFLLLKYPTTSPTTAAVFIYQASQTHHIQSSKEIIGFLPYWRLDDTKYIRFNALNEVIFFSLTADENGNIVKTVDNQTEPGWRWWNAQVVKDLIAKSQIAGDKFSLTIAMQKNTSLEKFLDNQAAQTNLIQNITSQINSRKLNGINIDFEYAGTPDKKYQTEFTNFISSLSKSLKNQSSPIELSLDTFPFSVRKVNLYDIPSLSPLVDKFIVMSYDYYATNSDTAGPVAPMYGYKQGKFLFDVSTTYQDYLSKLADNKIIMGVPYYGWDWPVEDGKEYMSKTLDQNDQNGYPAVMSYGRMRQDSDITPSQCQWDNLADEHWCSYTDSSQISHQVWLEDDQSIGIKFDFANQQNLGGIAIWTLGYDKNYPNLYDLIDREFTSPTNP